MPLSCKQILKSWFKKEDIGNEKVHYVVPVCVPVPVPERQGNLLLENGIFKANRARARARTRARSQFFIHVVYTTKNT